MPQFRIDMAGPEGMAGPQGTMQAEATSFAEWQRRQQALQASAGMRVDSRTNRGGGGGSGSASTSGSHNVGPKGFRVTSDKGAMGGGGKPDLAFMDAAMSFQAKYPHGRWDSGMKHFKIPKSEQEKWIASQVASKEQEAAQAALSGQWDLEGKISDVLKNQAAAKLDERKEQEIGEKLELERQTLQHLEAQGRTLEANRSREAIRKLENETLDLETKKRGLDYMDAKDRRAESKSQRDAILSEQRMATERLRQEAIIAKQNFDLNESLNAMQRKLDNDAMIGVVASGRRKDLDLAGEYAKILSNTENEMDPELRQRMLQEASRLLAPDENDAANEAAKKQLGLDKFERPAVSVAIQQLAPQGGIEVFRTIERKGMSADAALAFLGRLGIAPDEAQLVISEFYR